MMITTTLSSKNQITLPKFLLEIFGITGGDRLLVGANKEVITIKPIKTSIVDMLAGSMKVPKNKMGVPFEKAKEIAEYEAAKQSVMNSLP